MAKKSRHIMIVVGIVLTAYVISLGLRIDTFIQRTGAQGVEASYHVLWTIRALDASPARAHRFLPTVTLTPEPGNPIRWGATVPTPGGSFIYTSFPPLGFLLPHFAFAASGVAPGFLNLAVFNSLIGLAAAMSLGALARAFVHTVEGNRPGLDKDGWIVFTLVSVIYLFTREAMVSHGAVYWPQSFAQLVLIAGVWAAFRLFRGHNKPADLIALFAVCLLYPALEWTGFIFNIGLFLAILGDAYFRKQQNGAVQFGLRTLWPAGVLVVIATVIAGAAMLIHYFSAIGVSEMMAALKSRAYDRTFQASALVRLPIGYFVSFGALLPLSIVALWRALSARLYFDQRAVWLALFVAAFPMLENLIMMQHAYQFSFDRLKLAVPLLLVGALVLVGEKLIKRTVVILALAYLVLESNLVISALDGLYYRPWGEAVRKNTELVDRFEADPLAQCSVMGTKGGVRGYLNLTFDRDIFEETKLATLVEHAAKHGSCGVAMIRTDKVFVDLPRVTAIEVYDTSGQLLRQYLPET